MGEYWKPVNVTRREYIHPHHVNEGLKLTEWTWPGSASTAWHLARVRAQRLAREQLRHRIELFLAFPETLGERGKAAHGRICHDCRRAPRYPDHRCYQHTAYLAGTTTDRGAADSSEDRYLSLWQTFFGRVFALRGLVPGPTTLMDVPPGNGSTQVSVDNPAKRPSP